MVIDRAQKHRQMAARGKYQRLYSHLCSLPDREWKVSFADIETVLGFELPESARIHRPWWSNQIDGHSEAIAWMAAGWETAEVDVRGETLLFRRQQTQAIRRPSLNEVWPVYSAGRWPEGMSLDRADIYEDRVLRCS